jgi:hypothetical protein
MQRRAPKWVWTLPAIAAMLAFVGMFWFQVQTTRAQQPEEEPLHNPYAVKAVFLYSFGRYVEWPANVFSKASDPFVIGILGEDSFAGALDAIAKKKTIQGRNIAIQRFATLEAYKQPCHILFVSRSLTSDQQTALIAKMAGKPVFVVGETPGFAEKGGIADFIAEGDRIQVEINVEAARKAQLRMDAKLLSLAKLVGVPPADASN